MPAKDKNISGEKSLKVANIFYLEPLLVKIATK